MEDTVAHLADIPECNGKVGAVGYCLGGKLCYLLCCRTDIDCAVAYYGTYIEHNIREAKNLHRPFLLHMAMKDRWVQAEVNEHAGAPACAQPAGRPPQISRAPTTPSRDSAAKPTSKADADRALVLTLEFFGRHLGG